MARNTSRDGQLPDHVGGVSTDANKSSKNTSDSKKKKKNNPSSK